MYKINYFTSADEVSVIQLMKSNAFAVLMCVDENHLPVATQIPFLIDEREDGIHLLGHVMRKSDHWSAMKQHPHVKVLFTGPHAYISASWYTDPRQASTWNYMSVQASGSLTFLNDEGLKDVLEKTTSHYEPTGSVAGYREMDESYISKHLQAIEAFDIKVEKLEHTFKLSQNKDAETFANIISELEKGNSEQQHLAGEMKKHRK